MRTIIRLLVIAVCAIIYIVGYSIARHEDAQIIAVGSACGIVAIIIAFLILFHYKGTAIKNNLDVEKNEKAIGWVLIVISFMIIGPVAAMNIILSEEFSATMNSILFEPDVFAFVIFTAVYIFAVLACGYGLIRHNASARIIAKLLAIPMSTNFPIGLGLAVYIWWVFNPNRRERGANSEMNA